MFDFIKDLFEKEPNSAELLTLHFLAKRVYKEYGGCESQKAERLATKAVSLWLMNGDTDKMLRELWRRKRIA